jgi:hypothetical protein
MRPIAGRAIGLLREGLTCRSWRAVRSTLRRLMSRLVSPLSCPSWASCRRPHLGACGVGRAVRHGERSTLALTWVPCSSRGATRHAACWSRRWSPERLRAGWECTRATRAVSSSTASRQRARTRRPTTRDTSPSMPPLALHLVESRRGVHALSAGTCCADRGPPLARSRRRERPVVATNTNHRRLRDGCKCRSTRAFATEVVAT